MLLQKKLLYKYIFSQNAFICRYSNQLSSINMYSDFQKKIDESRGKLETIGEVVGIIPRQCCLGALNAILCSELGTLLSLIRKNGFNKRLIY